MNWFKTQHLPYSVHFYSILSPLLYFSISLTLKNMLNVALSTVVTYRLNRLCGLHCRNNSHVCCTFLLNIQDCVWEVAAL